VSKTLTIPDNWSATDIPDLTGKRFLITGATSGIGLAAASELARRNAQVVITARSVEKARDAIKKIGPGLVDYLLMDLTDLDSVKKAAARVDKAFDVVVLNAGVMATPFTKTVDGFELQMGTNHLGHFAFAGLIKNQIKDRLVVVSSFAHKMGNFGDNSIESIRNLGSEFFSICAGRFSCTLAVDTKAESKQVLGDFAQLNEIPFMMLSVD